MLDAVRLRSWGGEGKACEHPESPVPAVTGLLVSGGGCVCVCGSPRSCPPGEIPRHRSLALGQSVPAPGAALCPELGNSSRKGQPAGPVAHGMGLEGPKSGNLAAAVCR